MLMSEKVSMGARPALVVTAEAPLLVDPAMRALYEVAARVARGTIAVLVVGETGAGKEVLADYLHRRSPRAAAPMVRINCAALTESIVESELFGHDRGAFTGAATPRVGLIEAADGGTVLLDEVGELPLPVQAKLLRVLEDRAVTRVGATSARVVDVRFVAATNRDLSAEVAAGRFRRDLYFRLAMAVLAVPPLRARVDEIEPLARSFLADAAARLHVPVPVLTAAAVAALRGHAWPGNVRELKAAMERAVLVSDGVVDAADLPLAASAVVAVPAGPLAPTPARRGRRPNALHAELTMLERQRILDALEQCGGNQTRAAALLDIPRRTFVKRIAKHGIRRPRDR
jgi:two-component system response regulator AtoC